jgi:hypothetical protein
MICGFDMGNPKICELGHTATGQQYVVRLDIPMHHTGVVCALKPLKGVQHDGSRHLRRLRPSHLYEIPNASSVNKLHDDVWLLSSFDGHIMHGDNIWVSHPSHCPSFVNKTLPHALICT